MVIGLLSYVTSLVLSSSFLSVVPMKHLPSIYQTPILCHGEIIKVTMFKQFITNARASKYPPNFMHHAASTWLTDELTKG